MSYSTMQALAGQQQLQHSEPTPVQAWLQSLVQKLEWSYVALWSYNPQTRKLGWKGGHWRNSDTQGWNHEQYFSSTFKSCQFRTGYGSVGTAYAKGRNTWMRGSSFLGHRAGSDEQSEFLQQARISTAIFIPWSDGVLELGTCDDVPEDLVLMERIQTYFMTSLLPHVNQQGSNHPQLSTSNMQTGGVVPQAPLSLPQSSRAMMQPGSYASLSPLRHHLSDNHLSTQDFEPNSLNQQTNRRLASMPNMFLGFDAEGQEVMNTDHMFLPVVDAAAATRAATWELPTLTTSAGALQTQQTPNQMYYPPGVQPRTQPAGQTYRSRSGTTSSRESSLEEAASTLLSGDSPEQNVFFMASSQRQPSHSNTSSSPRRGTSSHSPELNQLEDTIGCQSFPETQESRVEDDLNLDPFLMLDGEPLESGTYSFPPLETGTMSQLLTESTNGNQNQSHNQSHNHGSNAFHGTSSYALPQSAPVPTQKPFKMWRNTRILAPPLQKKKKQDLLRRCIDMVKQIPHPNPPTWPEGVQNEVQAGMQGRRGASSSSPETVIDGIPNEPCFDQVPSRGQRRPRQNSRISSMGGAVHQGHDEAAMNHMMAERRRRVKQKENFAALRRLVPIISKADKASILGDAIVYLKDLQSKIEELEKSKAESERKFATLQNSYKELEQRNREIESMVQRPTRLHSI